MPLEAIGLALAIFAEIESIAKNIREQFDLNSENLEKVDSIARAFQSNKEKLERCEKYIDKNPASPSTIMLSARSADILEIKEVAEKAEKKLQILKRKYFPATDSSSSSESPPLQNSSSFLSIQGPSASPDGASTASQPPASISSSATPQNPSGPGRVFFSSFCRTSRRNAAARFKTKFKPLTRANKISKVLTSVEKTAEKVEEKLRHLITELGIDERIALSENRLSPAVEAFDVPVLPDNADRTVLNFDSPDTFEGQLKASVLESGNSKVVAVSDRAGGVVGKGGAGTTGAMIGSTTQEINARGSKKAYGVVGVGGVGKTVAMIGLAKQEDIKKKFDGGIFFMSFGKDATEEKYIEEIMKIFVVRTGSGEAERSGEPRSVKEAAKIAVKLLTQKPYLFLCDDLWAVKSESDSLESDFFEDLKILTSGHDGSKMVITTRDAAIASHAGSEVPFAPREPIGREAKAMFFAHAKIVDQPNDIKFQDKLEQLLEICCGLPLLLAIVGRRLAEEHSEDCLSDRLENHVEELESKRNELLEKKLVGEYPTSLRAAVMLSVEFLHEKLKDVSRDSKETYTVEQKFQSLSILNRQGWLPISVLGQLWKTKNAEKYIDHFSRLRLVSTKTRSWRVYRRDDAGRYHQLLRREKGLMLHDLTLDICRVEAKDQEPVICWHEALLNSYWESNKDVNDDISMESSTVFHNADTSEFQSAKGSGSDIVPDCVLKVGAYHRDWSSDKVPEDGYIHNNVSRHLVAAGKVQELWSLLLDPMWSKAWLLLGNFLALRRDLVRLIDEMNNMEAVSRQDRDKLGELKVIYKAVRCAWVTMEANPREYAFQMIGRLLDASKSMNVVDFFLKQVETQAEKPWMRPVIQCLDDPRYGSEMEIRLEDYGWDVAYFPSGKLLAVAVGRTVRVMDAELGTVIAECHGHARDVERIVISSDGRWIVSADIEDIRIWNKKGRQMKEPIICRADDRRSLALRDVVNDDGLTFHILTTVKGKIQAWDLFSQRLEVYNFEKQEQFGEAHYVACSRDGLILATAVRGSQTIYVWNMRNLTRIGQLQLKSHCRDFDALVVSYDGKLVACAPRNYAVSIWDLTCAKSFARKLPGQWTAAESLAFSKDGKQLFYKSSRGKIGMWSLRNAREPGRLIGVHDGWKGCVAVSPDGRHLATSSDENTVRIWSLESTALPESAALAEKTEKSYPTVNCITCSPDGKYVVSGHMGRTAIVWHADTCEPVGDPFSQHTRWVQQVTVSRNSKIVCSKSPKEEFYWNLETREMCPKSSFCQARAERSNWLPFRIDEDSAACFYNLPTDGEVCLAHLPEGLGHGSYIDIDRERAYFRLARGRVGCLQLER